MTGPYAYVRHPQYVAFILVMLGFLLQWPTIITLAMFPILAIVYGQLAKSEERDSVAEFGAAYEEYRQHVPGFISTSGKHGLQHQ
jgi:methanethiol S-methyltransferase